MSCQPHRITSEQIYKERERWGGGGGAGQNNNHKKRKRDRTDVYQNRVRYLSPGIRVNTRYINTIKGASSTKNKCESVQ